MSYKNKTERNKEEIKQNKNLNLKKYKSTTNKNKKIFPGKITSPNKKRELSKVILKGKLFSLINKSNIMTEDQFNDIKIRLTLSQLEKYKITKKNINKKFYYAQNNPNILQSNKNPSKFEDDYINMRELLQKFNQKEQDEILSFPQFFQLNSNEFLKELAEEKHKNLYEIICNEEDKEIELKNLKMKQREDLNNYKNNYNKAHHNNLNKKIIIKNSDTDEISNNNINTNNNNNIYNSNDSYTNRKSKKIVVNFKKSFYSRNSDNSNNLNNLNLNQTNNLNRVYNNSNSNSLNINKNQALIKKAHINSNINKNIIPNINTKQLNLNLNEHNKENIINYEEQEMSNESNSIENNNIFRTTKKEKIRLINKKRGRGRKTSYSSNKNNSISMNKNNSNENLDSSNNNNTNNKNPFELNYYILKDIKAKKINKVKGLYEIIHGPDELYMIVNKILYKYYKIKKNGSILNYESKLSFSLFNLFDSSINGDSALAFHNMCDNKFNTISLIETSNGHRFGGYAYECFESPNEYFDKKDNLSFVFSLDKMRIYDVIKGKYAISCDKNYGPYFRDDHICIVDEFFSKESGTCIKGKGFNTSKNYELNSGKKYFTVKRLQVFQIKIKKIK